MNIILRNSPSLIQNIKNKLEKGGSRIYFTRYKVTSKLLKNRVYSNLTKINSIINSEISESKENDEMLVEDLSCFK